MTMTIKDLGRWESVSIVERYTRSFSFDDAMRFYRGPLGVAAIRANCVDK